MRRKLKTIIALCLCVMMLPTGALAMSWNEFVTKANTISTQNPGGQTVLDSDSLGLGEGETIGGYDGTTNFLSFKDALLRGLTFVGDLFIGNGVFRLEDVTIISGGVDSNGIFLSSRGDSELYIDSDSKIGSADNPVDYGVYAGLYEDGSIKIVYDGKIYAKNSGISINMDTADAVAVIKNNGHIEAREGIVVQAIHYVPSGEFDEEGYEYWIPADINANIAIANNGSIIATETGIRAFGEGVGGSVVLFVDNSGKIVTTGWVYTETDSDTGEVWYYESANGISGSIYMENGSGILGVTNSGEIIVSRPGNGDGYARGIGGSLNANSGDVNINNSGNIDAEAGINVYAEHYVPTGEYDADGNEIWSFADINANVGVNNSGTINATESGISAYVDGAGGKVVLLIDNSGKIVATATESYVDAEGVTWYLANGVSATINTENTSGYFGITNSGEIIGNGAGLVISNYGTGIPIILNGQGNISGGEVTDENGVAYSRDIVLQMVLSNASGMTEEERNAYVKTMLEQSGILNYQNGNVEVRIYDETTWESFECIIETEKAAPAPKVYPKCGNISYSDEWLKQAWLCGGSRNLRLYTGPDMEERILFKENVSFAPDDAGKVLTLITNKKVTGTAFAKLGTDMIRMMLNRNINTLVIQTGDTTDVYPLAVIWDALVAAGHEDCQAVLLGGMNGDAMIINSAGEVEAL